MANNLFQRINEVRRKVDYLKKEKAVQNYKAVTHDQVTAILRNYFVEFGIVIFPSLVEGKMVQTAGMTAKGAPIYRYEAEFSFEFINCEDPTDRYLVARIPAHADDTGDKAPGKALSYAKKALMLKVFEIETGEDDESRFETAEEKAEKEAEKNKPKPYPQETFDKNFPAWEKAIKEGKTLPDGKPMTPEIIIAQCLSKGALTPEQITKIQSIKPREPGEEG